MQEAEREAVEAVLRQILRGTLDPQAAGMRELLHPEFAIGSPGVETPSFGRDDYLAAIPTFWAEADLVEFRDARLRIEGAGKTAVASLAVELVVDRSGQRSRATWRDVWVFTREPDRWLAVWRAILDFREQPA